MRKYTSRQIQAQKTKRKLRNAAINLFDKQGYANTTIEDISKKAGVSVGAFYHYYSSKSDIYFELFEKIDEYYEETVAPLMVNEDFYENIILFFRHYALYNSSRGLEAIKQLYCAHTELFIDLNRYMYRLLLEIIRQGKEKNQCTKAKSEDEILEFLCVMSRGLVYDWSLHKGAYDLEKKFINYLSALRCIIVAA